MSDVLKYGIDIPEGAVKIAQEQAQHSPIGYTPEA